MRANKLIRLGSLLFCPECGTLLDFPEPEETIVSCEQCQYQEKASGQLNKYSMQPTTLTTYIKAYENIVITTRSHPDAFPSALRQKRKTQTTVHESGETRTIVRRFIFHNMTDVCQLAVNLIR